MKFRDLINDDPITFLNILYHVYKIFFFICLTLHTNSINISFQYTIIACGSLFILTCMLSYSLYHILFKCDHATNDHINCINNFKRRMGENGLEFGFGGIIISFILLKYKPVSNYFEVLNIINYMLSSIIFSFNYVINQENDNNKEIKEKSQKKSKKAD